MKCIQYGNLGAFLTGSSSTSVLTLSRFVIELRLKQKTQWPSMPTKNETHWNHWLYYGNGMYWLFYSRSGLLGHSSPRPKKCFCSSWQNHKNSCNHEVVTSTPSNDPLHQRNALTLINSSMAQFFTLNSESRKTTILRVNEKKMKTCNSLTFKMDAYLDTNSRFYKSHTNQRKPCILPKYLTSIRWNSVSQCLRKAYRSK